MSWYGIRSHVAIALAFSAAVAGWTTVRARDTGVVTFSRLANIPSHNGVYRASLVAAPDGESRDTRGLWMLDVRTASGTPIPNASVALESWMPDEGRIATTRPRVAELGDGRYRVDGLRLDRRGWWNVKLAISAGIGTDSLAFNLVLR